MTTFTTPVSSPHIHGPNHVSRVMAEVIFALLPAVAVYHWLFGWGVLLNIVLVTLGAVIAEGLILRLRRRPVVPAITDLSAVVTALLLAIALPPLAPWWLPFIGGAFAIIFAKQLYGGLGYNPFNPAMIGYVALLISFPVEMTTWLAPSYLQPPPLDLMATLTYALQGALPPGITLDALTAATPLDLQRTRIGVEQPIDLQHAATPLFAGNSHSSALWLQLAILSGGLWLLWRRIISWHVPVAMLGTLALLALLFHLIDSSYPGPLFHISSGAALLGAFFIATDPVSGATSERGRLLFGAGVGVFAFVIRSWGGYPDAIAFSVLLMNMAAPTIDYYTQPRVYGHVRSD